MHPQASEKDFAEIMRVEFAGLHVGEISNVFGDAVRGHFGRLGVEFIPIIAVDIQRLVNVDHQCTKERA